MIEYNKNFCILKAFDLEQNVVDNCKKEASKFRVEFACEQSGLDFRILLSSNFCSEGEFREAVDNISKIIDDNLYADTDVSLEECIVSEAVEKGLKITVAESLTGGLVCSRIVNVAGSSSVLIEGMVTYSNESKVRRLHVKLNTIEEFGAISKQTATEMIEGQPIRKGGIIAVATTGCAGPSSDEKDTPVGVVFVGVGDNQNIEVEELMLEGNRNEIRLQATDSALFLLLKFVRAKKI